MSFCGIGVLSPKVQVPLSCCDLTHTFLIIYGCKHTSTDGFGLFQHKFIHRFNNHSHPSSFFPPSGSGRGKTSEITSFALAFLRTKINPKVASSNSSSITQATIIPTLNESAHVWWVGMKLSICQKVHGSVTCMHGVHTL